MATIEDAPSAEATLTEMMRRLGIDPGACVHPRTGFWLICARRKCRTCKTKDECRLALSMPGPPAFVRFCPNAEILQELLHEQPSARTDKLSVQMPQTAFTYL